MRYIKTRILIRICTSLKLHDRRYLVGLEMQEYRYSSLKRAKSRRLLFNIIRFTC